MTKYFIPKGTSGFRYKSLTDSPCGFITTEDVLYDETEISIGIYPFIITLPKEAFPYKYFSCLLKYVQKIE